MKRARSLNASQHVAINRYWKYTRATTLEIARAVGADEQAVIQVTRLMGARDA